MTGYIAEMRKLVGHRTIMQCAVSIICVDAQNRILMGKRSDNHKWGYSGGAIEIDEKVYENENRYVNEKYTRGGEFVENLVCDNIIVFSNRWLHLANFVEMLQDLQEYYSSSFRHNPKQRRP